MNRKQIRAYARKKLEPYAQAIDGHLGTSVGASPRDVSSQIGTPSPSWPGFLLLDIIGDEAEAFDDHG